MRLHTLAFLVVAALAFAAPASAQTFVFGAQGEPVQLDPAVITDGISSRITRQLYDGLVKYRGATTEVEPALAEKWEVSRDGKVWTFQIRKGVKFHDGNPLDAAAVVWNFERWWKAGHPQHDNQVKAGQTFEYWEAQFAGFDDKSIVSAVEAVGTHTVRITLKEPQAPFLANLAMFVFDIASPKAVERWGTEFGKHPVGTGAYKFVEWKPNQEVVLDANADYWGVKPKVKRLVVRNIKDNSQRLGALKAGEIHGMEGLNPDDVGVVKSDANLQLLLRPTNTTGYIAFNYKVKEFQDKRVRQAFAHAINKRAIVDALYGGTGLVASQFQPPALWGYNRELKDYEYSTRQATRRVSPTSRGRTARRSRWSSGTCRARGRTSPTRRRSPRRWRPISRRSASRPSCRPPSGRCTSTSARTVRCRSTCSAGRATTAIPTISSATSSASPAPRARASTATSRWPTCCCAPRSSRSSRSGPSSTGRPSSSCATTRAGSSSPTTSRRSRSPSA